MGALAAVAVLAAVVRAVGLGSQPLWWDEGWSIYFASLPLGRMLAATAEDIHPPLYYAILHVYTSLSGYSPESLRSLSLLFALALVGAVYCLGSVVASRRLGLVAAVLAAVAPLQVFYSQEGRMYALIAALSAFSWLALLAASDGRRTAQRWAAAYIILTAAALYTEYYAALLWIGQAVFVLIPLVRRRQPAGLGRRLVLLVAPLLAYVPWLLYALPKLVHYVANKESIEGYNSLGLFAYSWSYLSTFLAGHRLAGQPAALWAVALASAAVLVCMGAWRASRHLRFVALCLTIVPLVLGFVVNLASPFTPPYFERVLLYAATPVYLLAAAGVLSLVQRGSASAVAGAVLALATSAGLPYVWTQPRYVGRDYRTVFSEIRRYGSEGDAVLCLHPWQYGYALAYLPARRQRLVLAPTDTWSADPAARRRDLAALLEETGRVWFPAHQSLGRILESEVAEDLGSTGYLALSGWHGDETLLLAYARGGDMVAGGVGTFANGSSIVTSRYAPRARVGGAVPVELQWSALPSAALSVSVRLVDDTGTVWAATDTDVDSEAQRLALLVPWGTPAIDLRLALLASVGGTPLSNSSSSDGYLEIGKVSVQPADGLQPDAADLGYTKLDAASADGIVLVGCEPLAQQVRQGYDLEVGLWWALEAPTSREYVVYLQAMDSSGEVVAAAEERITGGVWPPTSWPLGATLRDRHTLTLPAHTTAGTARVSAALLDPSTRQPLALGRRTVVELGQVQVVSVARQMLRPDSVSTASVAFGGEALLSGYTAEPCDWEAATCHLGGSELRLTLVWRALAETGVRYHSFVHLLCGGEIVAQSDHQPGEHPTTSWLPGQYVVDNHILTLPNGLCTGATIAVGLYEPETQARLEPSGASATDDRRAVLFAVARP